jgi:hypothetical protein
MKKRIICVSREFGSGGRELGKRLADNLGFAYYDREIVLSLAEQTGMDENSLEQQLEIAAPVPFAIHFAQSFTDNLTVNDTTVQLLSLQTRLIKELAAKGITANAIAPAMIDTGMMRAVPEQLLNVYLKSCPTRRFGSVDELASAALFLASDDSSFVNGIVLPVNGGMFT